MKILVETIFLKTKASEWTSNKYKPLIFIYKTNRGGWQRVVTHNDWGLGVTVMMRHGNFFWQ